jgi:hypothetical protein
MFHGLLIGAALCVFSYAVFGQTPALEVKAAAADSKQQPEPRYVRYVTAYSIPLEKRQDAVNVLRFQVNSLSVRSSMRRPVRVTDTLYRVDSRDYGWNLDAWEQMVASPDGKTRLEPYFVGSTLPQDAEYTLRERTYSYGAIVRLDWFVAVTSLEPNYSRFLGMGNKLADVEKQFFVQKDGIEKFGLARGGAVLESIVVLHNRQLERWPTIFGYWWQSRDVNNNRKKANVLENVFAIEHDAGEFIFSAPNGLQIYYLANAAGEQQQEVPPDIAIDSRTTLKDKRVRNSMSCVTCHVEGVNDFTDVISKLLPKHDKSGSSYGFAKREQQAFEEFYQSDLGKRIAQDNLQYAAAVLACNGLTTEANATAYSQLIGTYLEGRVTLDIALRELGKTKEQLLAVVGTYEPGKVTVIDPHKLYIGTLNALLAEESVARDSWEEIFHRVAAACASK